MPGITSLNIFLAQPGEIGQLKVANASILVTQAFIQFQTEALPKFFGAFFQKRTACLAILAANGLGI